MDLSTACVVTFLGKNYTISCPTHEKEHLQQAALTLNKALDVQKQKFPHLSEFHLMLLCAVNVTHELLLAQAQAAQDKAQIAHVVRLLKETGEVTSRQERASV